MWRLYMQTPDVIKQLMWLGGTGIGSQMRYLIPSDIYTRNLGYKNHE